MSCLHPFPSPPSAIVAAAIRCCWRTKINHDTTNNKHQQTNKRANKLTNKQTNNHTNKPNYKLALGSAALFTNDCYGEVFFLWSAWSCSLFVVSFLSSLGEL